MVYYTVFNHHEIIIAQSIVSYVVLIFNAVATDILDLGHTFNNKFKRLIQFK